MRFLFSLLLAASACAAPPLAVTPKAVAEAVQLQAAIDAGATFVLVPKGSYQLDATLRLRSHLVLWCEPGAVLEAAPGAFTANTDVPEASLVALEGVENVEIHGCTFRGRKQDYQPPGEWNHCVRLAGVTNVLLSNVRAENCRGDGIYIGPLVTTSRKPSKNVTIERSVADANHRTGLAVVSVEGLTVRDSAFNNTKGTPTNCGVDLEPSAPSDRLAGVLFERCTASGNAASAYLVQMIRQNETSAPVSVEFRDCTGTGFYKGHTLLRVEEYGQNQLAQKPKGFIRWDDSVWANPVQSTP